jgi:SAM-dependent methyltransferase
MHSALLTSYIDVLQLASKQAPVLDLACGKGRNGLYLLAHNIKVVFADINESSLLGIKQSFNTHTSFLAEFWEVDFEKKSSDEYNSATLPLKGKQFSAVMVFNYLHRSLFEQIKQATIPGGFVIYETFTVDQPQFGRPKNPHFLLKPNELMEVFSDWKVIHSFEGIIDNEGSKKAIAQIVAQKPLLLITEP